MGTTAHGFHSVAPRCVRATRWGRTSVTQGDLGIVRRQGMAGIVRPSQTKGRATGNAKPSLKRPGVGADISASEIPADAVSGVGSGRGTLERDQNKGSGSPPSSGDAGWIQKTNRRGRPRTVWRRQVMKAW